MMYYVHESDGTIIGVCSRLEDAEAMAQTVGKEPKKYIVKKTVDTEKE